MSKLFLRVYYMLSGVVLISSLSFYGNSAEIDNEITKMMNNPQAIEQGETLFQQTCASCHGRDLSGATGFNLKDGEWIHGGEPTQILNSVNKGFMQAGMPGFANIYSPQQLQSVVAYILSKREGFEGLRYKIYQMNDKTDRKITAEKLIKSGQIHSNIADFGFAEVNDYSIVFEGDFYAPKDQDTAIWVQWGKPLDLEIAVNGQVVERVGKWNPLWKLARGKQHLKVTYYSGKNKPNQRNVSMVVTNTDMTIKLFPISEKGKAILADNKIDIKATNKTRVQRKKTLELPSYSIAVGLPSKMNYAFNTRSCSIVGVWEGDMLNVGPNVNGRGEDGSLLLGSWLFHFPETLHHETEEETKELTKEATKCRYKGYKIINDEPVFSYQIDDSEYTLFASSKTPGELDFNYRSTNSSQVSISLSLPELSGFDWLLNAKKIKHKQVNISANQVGNYTLSVHKN